MNSEKSFLSARARFHSSLQAKRRNHLHRLAKILAPLLLTLFSLPAFSAGKKDFSLELEPLFGLKTGRADEYVFLKRSDYDSDKLSELNWETRHEFYGGLKVGAGFKSIFLETSFTAGISSRTGEMKDSDWFNVLYSELENYQYKTNYSESDNYLQYDYSYNLKAGYSFYLPELKRLRTSIKLFSEFQHKAFKFNGKNGRAWYGNLADGHYAKYNDLTNQTVYDFSGEIISYKRQTSFFWLGVDVSLKFLEDFIFSTGFKASPYFYCESIDSHHLTGNDYMDVTPAYFAAFNWTAGAEYKITGRQSICINAAYFFMRAVRGDDYSKPSSQKKFHDGNKDTVVDGGAGERAFSISFSYKFKVL